RTAWLSATPPARPEAGPSADFEPAAQQLGRSLALVLGETLLRIVPPLVESALARYEERLLDAI
ncbi:MAG: hypothetical protein HYU66_01650, partial [Armatimonadetes bacterium]|nr:hypothetical protein [Armatimonadota bacterium]